MLTFTETEALSSRVLGPLHLMEVVTATHYNMLLYFFLPFNTRDGETRKEHSVMKE